MDIQETQHLRMFVCSNPLCWHRNRVHPTMLLSLWQRGLTSRSLIFPSRHPSTQSSIHPSSHSLVSLFTGHRQTPAVDLVPAGICCDNQTEKWNACRYLENVPAIVPLLEKEYRNAAARLEATQEELNDLHPDKYAPLCHAVSLQPGHGFRYAQLTVVLTTDASALGNMQPC